MSNINNSDDQNSDKESVKVDETAVSDENTTYSQEVGKQTIDLPLLLDSVREKGFELKEQIGEGQYSEVYRATWTRLPGVNIACKRIRLDMVDEEWKTKCLDRELTIIKKLKHKNIIEVYEVFKYQKLVFIFMQMADNGSIREYMFRHKYPLRESQAKIWFSDLMAGISYMHSVGVAHRDIKLDNFLLNQEFKALLSDFGFAIMDVSNTRIMRETMCGTLDYMAPEVQKAGPNALYDAKKADIYSMGVCLFEMVNFDKPFDTTAILNNHNLSEVFRVKVDRSFRYHSKIDHILSNDLKDLIHKLLEPDPQKRITIKQISRHKALKIS